MAHYAILNDDNVVIQVITGREEDDVEALPDGFASWEDYYGQYHGKRVLRTSYNTMWNQHQGGGTPFRGNYAGVGYLYLDEYDAFVPQKPHASWVLNDSVMAWEAPTPYPDDGGQYIWNEQEQNWLPVTTGVSQGMPVDS